MRKIASILLLLVCFSIVKAEEIDRLMRLKPSHIPYLPFRKSDNIAYLQTPFSKPEIIREINTEILENKNRIHAIHLVYTRFKEVDSYDQPRLNYFRFQELKKRYPELFKLKNVHWKVLEQHKAKTKETANNYFHGFVIYLKNEIPTTKIENVLTVVENILDSYEDSIVIIPPSRRLKIKKRKVKTGVFYPKSTAKRRKGIKYGRAGIWGRREKTYTIKDTTILWETLEKRMNIGTFNTQHFKNIHVYQTLQKIPKGKNPIIITDITGSMAPYSAEVMLWVKNQPQMRKNGKFIFFNDGDNEPDQYKKLGQTGGIYTSNSNNYDSIYACMRKTMLLGQGGYPPENYCEAILKGIEWFPEVDTVIVIADMRASASDIELLSKITKPVNIILAGDKIKLPDDYMEICLKTGGFLFYKGFRIDPKKIRSQNRTFLGEKYFIKQNGQIQKI